MNVEMIEELQQLKSNLARARNIAERQLRDPDFDPIGISSNLLQRIQVVTQDIDDIIATEEEALEDYYQKYVTGKDAPLFQQESDGSASYPVNGGKVTRPIGAAEIASQNGVLGFNPRLRLCAAEIAHAFCDCWVGVRASSTNGKQPEYTITIQPQGYTPNDIMLRLKSLGYIPAFKAIRELASSTWADFEVSQNGLAFELSSTVESRQPPELERYDEPAVYDDGLPF